MQNMHTNKNPRFSGFFTFYSVDKLVQLELLLLESTHALINFIICSPQIAINCFFTVTKMSLSKSLSQSIKIILTLEIKL